ncbi:MAG: hypothetical protein AB2A00_24840 [Myxococcota bacterium]
MMRRNALLLALGLTLGSIVDARAAARQATAQPTPAQQPAPAPQPTPAAEPAPAQPAPAPAPATTGEAPAAQAPSVNAPPADAGKAPPKTAPAVPQTWPQVLSPPGARKLPIMAEKYVPRPMPNTVDGKVWTSTLYTVSSPLQVEWGYGQIGAQVDADTLFGLPVGLHFDGFMQQRAYYRPINTNGDSLLSTERYRGRSGVRHPRYYTFDRVTEANLAVRHPLFSLTLGRAIVPYTYQSTVDGVHADVGILDMIRVGGFAGFMPNPLHPRMWLDHDYRNVDGFFPTDTECTKERREANWCHVSTYPVTSSLEDPDFKQWWFDFWEAQTVLHAQFMTAGGYFALRLPMFTSDTSVQATFFTPLPRYQMRNRDLANSQPVIERLGRDPLDTAVHVVDAVLINNATTFRPTAPLNFSLRLSWDPWGLRAWNLQEAIDNDTVLGTPPKGDDPLRITDYSHPLLDTSFGLREALADMTFRGDLPLSLNVQFHHYQSYVTALSWNYYQSDMLQQYAFAQVDDARRKNGNPYGEKQVARMKTQIDSKVFNLENLGMVQRERLRVLGWVSPMGFFFPTASAQLYSEAFMEWRRDHPKPRPIGGSACARDRKDADGNPGKDGVPELYYTKDECDADNEGKDRYPNQDDYVRVGLTAGLRDPTLYDNITYDISATAIDSWHNRALIARARVGVQAFDYLFLDSGFTYELSENERYYTSDVDYRANGSNPGADAALYPPKATGQAFIFDASAMYRVAWGLTFDLSYMAMFEEEPLIQEFILGDGKYIPRDLHQANQMLLLRASYRM